MPVRTLVRGPLPQGFDGSTPPPADETPFQIDDDDGLLKWLDADGHVKTAGGAGGGLPDPWTIDATALTGPKFVATDVDGEGTPTVLGTVDVDGLGSVFSLAAGETDVNYGLVFGSSSTAAELAPWVKHLYDTYGVYGTAFSVSNNGHVTFGNANDSGKAVVSLLPGDLTAFLGTFSNHGIRLYTNGQNVGWDFGTDLSLTLPGPLSSPGLLKGNLQTNANATTGLSAGALAATTNASIVIKDGSGQAYRVPVII